MKRLRAAGLAMFVCAVLGGATAAEAHHSFAMFDSDRRVTIEGTLTELQWTNPHVYIEVDVRRPNGQIVHYSIEGASPSLLRRIGWRRTDFHAGERVRVEMHPLRNGNPGGVVLKVTMQDGRVLSSEFDYDDTSNGGSGD